MYEERSLNTLKEKLNDLVGTADNNLCDGEILQLSQTLDELIVEYYSGEE